MKGPVVLLLVEDDEDFYLLTKKAIAPFLAENELLWFRDGEEFMAYLGSGIPESRNYLVLLDLNMPKLNGYEVLRRMKSHPTWCRIPVAVLTTSKSEADATKSLEQGAHAFIAKPLTMDKLTQMIEEI